MTDRAALQRRIIHVDMDAFYASVEQRDDASLRGRPVAVGGSSARGVVAAASYEARRFGVHSAMASVTALRRCPELVFVRPRFDAYRAASQQIHAIFARYTAAIQPLSLDEAYLDVTRPLRDCGSATAAAQEIRAAIRAETGLIASAGISYNKLLAKLASDHRKPDGLFVITPRLAPAFVAALPVERLHGVGPVTAARLHRLGIRSGLDLRHHARDMLVQHFGRFGEALYDMARGVDERPVQVERLRKSVGAETTFGQDLRDFEAAVAGLQPLLARVWAACARDEHAARTVTLKMKYADFRIATRSRSAAEGFASETALRRAVLDLLRPLFPPPLGIRLLGVAVSNFAEPGGQLSLGL